MRNIVTYEYNMDTACVELRFDDGTMLAIDTIAAESSLANTMSEQAEMDYLIYNKPLEYAALMLNGGMKAYISGNHEHCLAD